MAEVGLVGMAYELLRDLGWARGEGAGHCRHKNRRMLLDTEGVAQTM